ncbi:MAG: DUF1501 domain-containing protein [Myxococcota bacterium]
MTSRRDVLRGLGALALAGAMPGVTVAHAATDQRLILMILRGGLDGIAMLPPIGDPDLARIRGRLADEDAINLDGAFGLHPELSAVSSMYTAGDALLFHAVGLPGSKRSHFEAQDLLEGGGAAPRAQRTGWLNRALGTLGDPPQAAAFGQGLPLVLRGNAEATSIDPGLRIQDSDALMDMLSMMYAEDPQLSLALQQSLETQALLASVGDPEAVRVKGRRGNAEGQRKAGAAIGTLLADPTGPRVAVIEVGGWDTHAGQQNALRGRLNRLNAALEGLKSGLGEAWSQTALLAVTEFGRTVEPNGTGGTDHGTASAALLLGGAVRGGRVQADWPGLKPRDRFDGRDLQPTTDVRAITKGLLLEHLGISRRALATVVYPDSDDARPMTGLIG